jgi:hypothetical protein
MDLEHPRNLASGRPLLEQASGKGYLFGCELGWTTEAHATLHGCGPADASALMDQSLRSELGDPGKHG